MIIYTINMVIGNGVLHSFILEKIASGVPRPLHNSSDADSQVSNQAAKSSKGGGLGSRRLSLLQRLMKRTT